MSDKILGIDLGTTNSAVAVTQDGKPVLLQTKDGPLLPSVFGYGPDDQPLVGREALNQLVVYPERTQRSVKRLMGRDEALELGAATHSPEEVSSFILGALKKQAEAELGEELTRAVITVPAYFSDEQRRATIRAGELAGLEVERLLNEPTAAALAYGVDRCEDQFLLVFDLGGGTFDVSIIEKVGDVLEVRASAGDNELGGDDFDERLLGHLIERFQEKHPDLDPKDHPKALSRLRQAAERAKIGLSSEVTFRVTEEFLIEGEDGEAFHLDVEIDRATFVGLIDDLLRGTLRAIDDALQQADLEPCELSEVLLVGGSTRIPRVWELVEEHIGIEPHLDQRPEEVVALGAALQAGILAGEEVGAVLVDVAPYSLGIEHLSLDGGEIVDDCYKILIPRNSPVPVSQTDRFYTMHPDQSGVEIVVYQGHEPKASRNKRIAKFRFDGISSPDDPEAQRDFLVTFKYNVNGVVEVSATDPRTKREESIQITVEGATGETMPVSGASEPDGDAESRLTFDPNLRKRGQELLERLRTSDDEDDEEVAEELEEIFGQIDDAESSGDVEELEELSERMVNVIYEHF